MSGALRVPPGLPPTSRSWAVSLLPLEGLIASLLIRSLGWLGSEPPCSTGPWGGSDLLLARRPSFTLRLTSAWLGEIRGKCRGLACHCGESSARMMHWAWAVLSPGLACESRGVPEGPGLGVPFRDWGQFTLFAVELQGR